MNDTLSIISVVYRDPAFWEHNLRLTRHLNPDGGFRWLVVDNSETPVLQRTAEPDVTPLDGVGRPVGRNAPSRHHALAIQRALAGVATRHVLVLDHDFFIVRPDWVRALKTHAGNRNPAFFGSQWHPRWYWQYRDFPSVHCLLIDLEQVSAGTLDFAPSIASDRYWRLISKHRWYLPDALRVRLQATRIRDTGWKIRKRYMHAGNLGVELLTPVYHRPDTAGARFEERFDSAIPDSWKLYPSIRRDFAAESFLSATVPEAVDCGWEEFFWDNEPFGFHLRRFGRSLVQDPVRDDLSLLDKAIAHYAAIEARRTGDGVADG